MIPRSLFPLIFLAAMAPLAALAAPASSSGAFSVRIEGEYGEALPTWYSGGATYVMGSYGSRYNVRVYNNSGERVEAVVTVDGRDAISGDVGDYVRQRGYVVPPYGSVLIEGFRQSMSDVASFRFTTPGDSYSGRRGTPQNVGVVGVAIFRERGRPVVYRPVQPPPRPWYYEDQYGMRDRAGDDGRLGTTAEPSAAPAAKSADAAGGPIGGAGRSQYYAEEKARRGTVNNLGTQYGEQRYSPVEEVPFVRARSSRPDHLMAVYYDDAAGLARRGFNVYPYYGGNPAPFPDNHFAPPPP